MEGHLFSSFISGEKINFPFICFLVTGGHTKNLALGENARLGKTVVLKSAEIYDPINKTWTDTAEMNTERSDHKAILINGDKVLVSGGYFLKKSDSENMKIDAVQEN